MPPHNRPIRFLARISLYVIPKQGLLLIVVIFKVMRSVYSIVMPTVPQYTVTTLTEQYRIVALD